MYRWFALLALALMLGTSMPGGVAQPDPGLDNVVAREPALDPAIEPALQERLAVAAPDEYISAIVLLRERVDFTALYPELTTLGRQARHERVVRLLQETAARTQGPLLAHLEQAALQGRVSQIEPFWVANAILVEATPGVLTGLAARGDVLQVRENRTYHLEAVVNPPAPDAQPDSPEPNLLVIGADQMWAQGWDGSGVLVATIDTGAYLPHPALQFRWRGYEPGVAPEEAWFDYFEVSPTPSDTLECYSHGTHVMGTIVGDDGAGNQIGVAPGAHWIAARIFGPPGVGCSSSDASKLAGWQWVVDPDGDPGTVDDFPHVVNRSGGEKGPGGGGYCRPLPDPIWDAVSAVVAAGATVFFGAGNEGPEPETIISWASRVHSPILAFSIGNLDTTGPEPIIRGSSSRGPSPCDHVTIKPEVVAPGTHIRSAIIGGYWYKTGTSMATPHSAGAAALLWQAFPYAGAERIQYALLDGTQDLGPVGEDNDYGTGLIYLPTAYGRFPEMRSSTITASAAVALPQAHLTYTVSLHSQSHLSWTTRLTDTLPGTVTFVPGSLWASSGDYAFAGGVVTWTEFLLPDQRVTLTFAVTLTGPFSDGNRVVNSALVHDSLTTLTRTVTTTIDLAPPSSRAASPPYASAAFTVTFAASDTVSGVDYTRLWARYEQGAWAHTGLTLTGAGGAFLFSPTLGEGRYDLATQAVDQVGWEEAVPAGEGDSTTLLDTTAPASQAASPAYATTAFTVTFAASDTLSGVDYTRLWARYEQGSWAQTGLTLTGAGGAFLFSPTLGDGRYDLATQAVDRAGLEEAVPTGEGDSTTRLDTTPPTSQASSPRYATTAFTVTFAASDTVSGVDYTRLWARCEQGAWAQTGLTLTGAGGAFLFSPTLGEGRYDLATQAVDRVGWEEAVPAGEGDSTTRLDTTPPTSQASSPPYASAAFTVTFAASDTVSGVDYTRLWARYEQGAWAQTGLTLVGAGGAFLFTPTLGEGRYDLATQAVDRAGLEEAVPAGEGDSTTRLDTTPPTSQASSPPYASAAFTVTFAASDTVSGVDYTRLWARCEQGAWAQTGLTLAGAGGAFLFSPTLGEGRYDLATQAVDHAGWEEPPPEGVGDAATLLDTTAPESMAFSPASSPVPTFTVSWSGDDGPLGSGIVGYQIEVRPADGVSTWTVWISQTVALSDTFTGVAGQDYCFRSRAHDRVGHVEPPPGDPWGDSCTQVEGLWRIYLPLLPKGVLLLRK